MTNRSILMAALASCVLLGTSGCAIFSKGRTQMVTVRSVPSGATAMIDGETVGTTPFKVRLPRNDVYRVDLMKDGFESQSALLLPVPNEFEGRYLRWGIDYDLGAMTDLAPQELVLSLRPTTEADATGDRFANMSAQVARADAMLANGELSQADHRQVVEQIINSYAN